MAVTEIKNQTSGFIGWFHDVECATNDSVLIFQLPRATNQIGKDYAASASRSLVDMLPPGRKALVIGCDVNVYELCGEAAVMLRLKGIL